MWNHTVALSLPIMLPLTTGISFKKIGPTFGIESFSGAHTSSLRSRIHNPVDGTFTSLVEGRSSKRHKPRHTLQDPTGHNAIAKEGQEPGVHILLPLRDEAFFHIDDGSSWGTQRFMLPSPTGTAVPIDYPIKPVGLTLEVQACAAEDRAENGVVVNDSLTKSKHSSGPEFDVTGFSDLTIRDTNSCV